jgi:hypothetical protein
MDEVWGMAEKSEIYLGEPYCWGGRSEAFEHAAKEGPVVTGQIYHLQCFFSQYFMIIGFLLTNWLLVFCSYTYHPFSLL